VALHLKYCPSFARDIVILFVQQYEIIHNPQTVDLLVSIAHSAATEGVIDEPLPIGMALRVPLPDVNKLLPAPAPTMYNLIATSVQQPGTAIVGSDGLCDFDDLSRSQVYIEHILLILLVFKFFFL